MEAEYYEFCGVLLKLTFPQPLGERGQGELFRAAPGQAQIDIHLLPVQSLPAPAGVFCGTAGDRQIWRSGEGIVRQTRDAFRRQAHMQMRYQPDSPGRVEVFVRQADWVWATRSKYLWAGLALNQLLLHWKTLLFHGAYITWRGRGILFTAPSCTGKSTQAELWQVCRGAEVINGDKAAVSLGKAPMIHGIPFSGTSGICRNVSAPLAAVVVLSQAPENTIRRMGAVEAVSAICSNVFADQTVPEEWAMALNLMLDLAASVPIYALACTPDERAVQTLEEAMK